MTDPTNAVLAEQIKTVIKQQEAAESKAHESRKLIFEELRKITVQTTKTNGRVTRNEEDIREVKEQQKGSHFLRGKLSILFWGGAVLLTALISGGVTYLFSKI